MNKKYICAVGDSYVFGDELVPTYFKDEFSEISEEDFGRLEYEICLDKTVSDKFYALLDSMRFSSLVANDLDMGHFNYASGGASQESIKFQAHLLMNNLKKNNIDPSDTIWLVGLTTFTRSMYLADPHDIWHNMKVDSCQDNDYVWSRYSAISFFGDREEQYGRFSPAFTKEVIARTSDTTLRMRWVLNILDTVNLLIANGVEKFYILSMFNGTQVNFSKAETANSKAILEELIAHIDNNILPSRTVSFDQMFHESDKCKNGHPSKIAHRRFADYIVQKIKGEEE